MCAVPGKFIADLRRKMIYLGSNHNSDPGLVVRKNLRVVDKRLKRAY